MKFSINTKYFYKAINKVSRAISTKTTIPILTGIKIEATDDGLNLTGSDADITIVSKTKPDKKNQLAVTETGSIVLPAKFFMSVIKSMPDKTTNLSVGDDFQTVITSGKSRFKINGLDAGNYPHLPKVDSGKTATLSGDLLKSIIQNITINASTQESRPLLTGVHFVAKDNALKAVATDSHRLGSMTLDMSEDANFDLVIPAKSLTELARVIPNHADVNMASTVNQTVFYTNDTMFYSRLLEGNYPDTSQLIPKDQTTTLQMKASDLLPMVERCSIVSHASRNNVVNIDISSDKGQIKMATNSPDVGNNQETKSAKIDGKNLHISCNPDYLHQALSTLGDAEITLKFLSSLRPFVIVPSAQKSDKRGYSQLITPVRTF